MTAAYDVTLEEIREYWEDWYFTVYGIESYYFDMFYEGNGVLNWEAYFQYHPDGPAFGGASWLFVNGNLDTGVLQQAFMWWRDNQCFFSLGYPENPDPASSGECTIEGHETIGYEQNITDITWYFTEHSEFGYDFVYHNGQWGPVAEMTDSRYKVVDDD